MLTSALNANGRRKTALEESSRSAFSWSSIASELYKMLWNLEVKEVSSMPVCANCGKTSNVFASKFS